MNYKIALAFLALLSLSYSNQFEYHRNLTCAEVKVVDQANNKSKCIKWTEETHVKYVKNFMSFCFSQNTYVMTPEGPKRMRQLGPEDQLLGLNQENSANQFSKIKTWLHRDEQAIVKYATISTNVANASFEASDYHNIAFLNAAGKIDFKFTKLLEKGDELVSFPVRNLSVNSVGNYTEKQGLFSPFTELGNYYVLHQGFDPKTYDKSTEPMILVHVLSQVKDPNSELSSAVAFVDLAALLRYKQQPTSKVYVNPLVSSWNFIFGNNWNGTLQSVKYKYETPKAPQASLTLNHNQFRTTSTSSYSSPSYSSYSPSYSSYSSYSPSYSSYSPSYSSYSSPSYSSYNSYSSPFSSYSSYPYSRGYGYSPYYGAGAGMGAGYSRQRQQDQQMKSLGQCISILFQFPLFG